MIICNHVAFVVSRYRHCIPLSPVVDGELDGSRPGNPPPDGVGVAGARAGRFTLFLHAGLAWHVCHQEGTDLSIPLYDKVVFCSSFCINVWGPS